MKLFGNKTLLDEMSHSIINYRDSTIVVNFLLIR